MKRAIVMLPVVASLCILTGCAAFRVKVQEKDPEETKSLDVTYDYKDLNTWANGATQAILSHPFPPAGVETPLLVSMGIQNRTMSHLDMKALADSISTKLLDSGKVRFVNGDRRDDLLKEQGYQLANSPPEFRIKTGKQLGARYMLTGSLIEIGAKSGRQVRISKKEDVYYQLTVELTDLETGEITLRKQMSRLRRASWPLIGW